MRNKKNRNQCKRTQGYYSDVYWQSAVYTSRLYNALRNQVLQMALNRFHWIGLPDTCNARYLETALLFNGCATIAHPLSQPNTFYSTKMVQTAKLNVYDNPTKWRSVGNNGWHFDVTPFNGVVVWDNTTRFPVLDMIDIQVRELVDIYRTRQLNRMHMKMPYLITVPNDMELAAVNTVKQILGGEPAIIGNNYMREIDINAINMGVPYLGMELDAAEANCWNRIYQSLGIGNLTFKAERQIQDEVQAYKEPTDLLALSPLESRRAAADILNKRFGLDVHVVWAQDNTSANYNAVHNLESLAKLVGGKNGGFGDIAEAGEEA